MDTTVILGVRVPRYSNRISPDQGVRSSFVFVVSVVRCQLTQMRNNNFSIKVEGVALHLNKKIIIKVLYIPDFNNNLLKGFKGFNNLLNPFNTLIIIPITPGMGL